MSFATEVIPPMDSAPTMATAQDQQLVLKCYTAWYARTKAEHLAAELLSTEESKRKATEDSGAGGWRVPGGGEPRRKASNNGSHHLL